MSIERAVGILIGEIDDAADGTKASASNIRGVIDHVVDAAAEKAKVESRAEFDGLRARVDFQERAIEALRVKFDRMESPSPAPAPPAPPEWEVWVQHYYRDGSEVGGRDVIGRYPTEERADEVAALLNNMTSQEHYFGYEQV